MSYQLGEKSSKVIGMLKAAISADGREENDFYPTPVEATIALARAERLPQRIWEPACGQGHIGKTLEQLGHTVVATDLIYRGYGRGGVDFLSTTQRSAGALVTNPPFGRLGPRFVEHAVKLEIPHIAMLLNVNFWHAANRQQLWDSRPPSRIYALCWRLDFTGSDRPYFNCIWCVWDSESVGTQYARMRHPFK